MKNILGIRYSLFSMENDFLVNYQPDFLQRKFTFKN